MIYTFNKLSGPKTIPCLLWCLEALLRAVCGWESSFESHALSFLAAQNILEVSRQYEKNQNFPPQVVSGDSYNKKRTNYGKLSVVGQSLIEDWNPNEIIFPAK